MSGEKKEVIDLSAECATSVWDIINKIASILGIISAIATIVAAFRVKRYANSIVQANSAESLYIANEKLEQAKDCFLQLRTIKYGQKRGVSPTKIQEGLTEIELLLDQTEKKTPSDKLRLIDSIGGCKESLNKCVTNPTGQNVFANLGADLDNARKEYQKVIEEERYKTIKNLKG